MALQSFATPADMAARSGGAIPADRPYLDKALAAASRRIRNYCGWHIFPSIAVEDLRVRWAYGRPLWLPTTYLTSLEAISVNAIMVDAIADVEFTEGGRVDFYAWGAPSLISFTHGYAEVPEDVVDLTLELATGELQSAGGAIREQTIASSVTWARASGKLTRDDKDDMQEYRIGYRP